MKVLELFAGTRSIGKAFEAKGHEVFSVEWDKNFENINLYEDILKITAQDILTKFGKPDVIWASPDCTTFSIAAISHHRRKNPETGNLDPVSDYAKFCDKVDQHVLALIAELKPTYYFIENPRGGLRKMSWMQKLPRYTVTYCQYGDTRMKPTDIWTNHPDPKFKPMCKNGDSCHVPAPRGAKTGTQGLKGSVERSRIPEKLCEHIVDICEEMYFIAPTKAVQEQSTVYGESSFGTYAEDIFGTLKACGGNNGGGGSETLIIENKAAYGIVSKGNGDCFTIEEKHTSLTTGGGQAGQGYPCVLVRETAENDATIIVLNDQGGSSMNIEKDCISPTLRAESHNNEPIVFHTMQDPITSETVTPCLSSGSPNGQAVVGVNVDYAVRRLTPLECERLQGYPDGWTDIGEWVDTNGKTHAESTDSARYKAIGNSIAPPPWAYVLQRLSICCGDDITMASLFDGLGGFPLIWERLNGEGSCLWASEIEEFPIAVTKRRFNGEGSDNG